MHRSLIAVALLLLAPLATAQVYKWTDASGTVHYSQAAPAAGVKFEKVVTTGTDKPLVAPPPNEAVEQPETPAGPVAQLPDTPENRKSLCSSLQANLATLNGSGPVVMQKDGKTSALDAAQRKQQIATAQAQYDQFCADR